MTNLLLATTYSDFQTIAQLADTIWHQHYEPIIGLEQVNYMLLKFQSVDAIKSQIETGYEYYIIMYIDKAVGYTSIKKDAGTLFLSKIYVLSTYRGMKIGKTAMKFIENKAMAYQCESITLTVNKNNTNAIATYESLGFLNVEALVMDIGSGYVMDDFKMMKML